MQKTKFVNNEIYHIYNRGVDKRKIFMDEQDHSRFIHDLFEFNDDNPAPKFEFSEVGLPEIEKTPRNLIVEILAFCLMPNHFHLMLRQKSDNGITQFMRKLGTGYTNYFNQKYKRSGSLFQGIFKSTLIDQDAHFIHLPYYIHLNPLDLITPEWRERELKDFGKAKKFLENYRWSSHLDYTGKKNFPSVTQREFLTEFFGEPQNYNKMIYEWLKDLDLSEIEEKTLE